MRLYAVGGGAAPSLKYTLKDAREGVWTVAFSGDSRYLASGSMDGKVRLYVIEDVNLVEKPRPALLPSVSAQGPSPCPCT